MYCTGGIRCERASALLKQRLGVKQVFQLSGGIHRYIDAFGSHGLFRGKNFVFDRRLAIGSPAEQQQQHSDAVVGECSQCQKPWDQYSKQWLCAHCNAMVLVCGPCAGRRSQLQLRLEQVPPLSCGLCLHSESAKN